MELSFNETVAFAHMLTTLAMIDNELHPREQAVIIKALKVDSAFLMESLTAPTDKCILRIKELETSKHAFLLKLIHDVIRADGICKKSEMEFTFSLLNELGLSRSINDLCWELDALLVTAKLQYSLRH